VRESTISKISSAIEQQAKAQGVEIKPQEILANQDMGIGR
jgi:hypothetical protein